MKRKLTPLQLARRISLGIFLGASTLLAFLHQKLADIPSVDALCPFGGLETLQKLLAGGELLKRLTPSNLVLLGLIIVLGIVLSRFFCGWICAFGALQGVFGSLGKAIFKRRFEVPAKLDRVLRYFKYVVLAAVLFLTWQAGSLIIRPYDPWAAYAHLGAGLEEVWAEFAVGFVILIAAIILSMLYERAFCKYACPLGAFNAILSRIPLFRIRREQSTCVSCSICDRSCPMNVQVMDADRLDSPECIACGECVSACPTMKNTLFATLAGRKVPLLLVALLGLGLFAGTLVFGKTTEALKFTEPKLKEIAATGNLNIADIKGSSTWAQVAEAFGIELGVLYQTLEVDPAAVPPETRLKDTAAIPGYEAFRPGLLRTAVAVILGIPYEGEEMGESH